MIKKRTRRLSHHQPSRIRDKIFLLSLYLMFLVILGRLFYWQVIKGGQLQAVAQSQYQKQATYTPDRGKIYTADNYLLVGNQEVFKLYADPQAVTQDAHQLSETLTPLLLDEYDNYREATQEAEKTALAQEIQTNLEQKINQKDKQWIALKNKISEPTKDKIAELNIYGLGFEPYKIRFYPEASMAAHLTGFVGKDEAGQDTGYFGVEGAMEKELSGKPAQQFLEIDALGLQHVLSKIRTDQGLAGRDVILTIHRDLQFLVEQILQKGIEKYGAKSGEVIVMDPRTGQILALAAWPQYDQATFYKYDPALYKNPTLADQYEPGSTFKIITVSAGIDTESITPDTTCPDCAHAKQIGQYTIRTWNDVYHPDITVTEALAKSDNTAMIFVANQVGQESMVDYIKKFGIGQQIQIDLQEDTSTPLREQWGEIHLATASFGQGIVTNSLQMVRAVGAIANQGQMVRPYIVDKVIDPNTNKEITTEPMLEEKVVTPQTATQVTKMMVEAAEEGEAQWIASQTHTIAGKTGTSQVVTENGYDPEKTITSFIGFAPADDPKFVMLVKLVEPSSSPWAAETAAPLWYQLANKLFLLMSISPDK